VTKTLLPLNTESFSLWFLEQMLGIVFKLFLLRFLLPLPPSLTLSLRCPFLFHSVIRFAWQNKFSVLLLFGFLHTLRSCCCCCSCSNAAQKALSNWMDFSLCICVADSCKMMLLSEFLLLQQFGMLCFNIGSLCVCASSVLVELLRDRQHR